MLLERAEPSRGRIVLAAGEDQARVGPPPEIRTSQILSKDGSNVANDAGSRASRSPPARGLGWLATVTIQGGPTNRCTSASHCLTRASRRRLVDPGRGIERKVELDPVRLAVDRLRHRRPGSPGWSRCRTRGGRCGRWLAEDSCPLLPAASAGAAPEPWRQADQEERQE